MVTSGLRPMTATTAGRKNNIVETGLWTHRHDHPRLSWAVRSITQSPKTAAKRGQVRQQDRYPQSRKQGHALYSSLPATVAMLHNPILMHRSVALWISFDGMKTWPDQRVLVAESTDGPKGKLNYPDGFVSKDKKWLHFAYDDNGIVLWCIQHACPYP